MGIITEANRKKKTPSLKRMKQLPLYVCRQQHLLTFPVRTGDVFIVWKLIMTDYFDFILFFRENQYIRRKWILLERTKGKESGYWRRQIK